MLSQAVLFETFLLKTVFLLKSLSVSKLKNMLKFLVFAPAGFYF
ncbi:hypothetical protein HMPREF0645_0486 [Hallella bergensis DSM 17361]|uniref:Uncharacterized protein n=1 Tax=Hallella bergensis DSM 17361 TaxID=585502 RepID=D1PU51_9BACT|nr:hypothetical protein HMPREF0645_0486 [Hallella bergensis DSM 17361]